MNIRSNGLAVVTISVLALSFAACSSDRSTAPSSQALANGTATISGTVNSGTAARAVSIVGASSTSGVDPAGRFELRSVPSGDVLLQFSGTGLDARIMITGVNGGDQIRVVVTITGSSVVLEDQDRVTQDNRVELEGTISAGACGSFTLNGVTVTTNTLTTFDDGVCADIRPGRRVEVKGTRQGTGLVTATRVEFE